MNRSFSPVAAILSSACLLIVSMAVSGCSPDGATRPLRVGMELSYPPFEMTDTDGRPTGVSVRLAEALAAHLGRDLTIENITFDGLIPALKTGKIDCIISSMTATPERARSIAFSDPYLKTGLALLVAKASPVNAAADLDQPGRVVAVKKGTTGHQCASQAIKQAKLLVLDKESAAVLEVAQGKADAFIYDSLSVYQNHKRHPDTTRAILQPFREETWAVGLRPGDEPLRSDINKFLKAFRESGGFEKLGDEFLPEEKASFKAQGIPFYF
ncbi:MAG: transporter substrate-binding domain-containing protein [Planctomycetota bacterium]|nr:transporter substrate-binding domain-containing protein [Planctomycetota bacterium]